MTNTERIQANNAELREAIALAESLPDAADTGDDEQWFEDGKTHIWITLPDGRTSPLLGCCPNGTVTVDWGDGTEPDVLTGTSVTEVQWTPTHNYAEPGDYVIALSVDGEMGFYGKSSTNQYSGILRYSGASDNRNQIYQNAVKKVEMGEGVTSIGKYAFSKCYSLTSVFISGTILSFDYYAFHDCNSLTNVFIQNGLTFIGENAFYYCYALQNVSIPESVTSIGKSAFQNCPALQNVSIPEGVTSIGTNVFSGCSTLQNVSIPERVTSISDYYFYNCYTLQNVSIPEGVTSIGASAFYSCKLLQNVSIPEGVTSIGGNAFNSCASITAFIIPESVSSIGSGAFTGCSGVLYYDFTACTSVPVLAGDAFYNIPSDCKMLIPSALYDEWSTATNWVTYARYMVAV